MISQTGFGLSLATTERLAVTSDDRGLEDGVEQKCDPSGLLGLGMAIRTQDCSARLPSLEAGIDLEMKS